MPSNKESAGLEAARASVGDFDRLTQTVGPRGSHNGGLARWLPLLLELRRFGPNRACIADDDLFDPLLRRFQLRLAIGL